MKIRLLLGFLAALLIAGCATGPGLYKEGWKYRQKSDLLDILATDKYGSLCELKPVYEEFLAKEDPKLLNKLLIGYVKNLENSCINISAFKSAQSSRQSTKAYYKLSTKRVSTSGIMSQLHSGKSIEDILAPHIPTSPQFERLLSYYQSIKGSGDIAKIRKIKLNLERTKLMKDGDWNTYVLINVPEYRFRLFESGRKSMQFPVVTGKKTWQTPIFNSELKYIVLNPAWNVPDNIARSELIPKLIKNPNALKRKNMVIRQDYNVASKSIDPKNVDWKKYLTKEYKHKRIPFKIIQKASSRNALGTVKFMFPNRFSVYMHDTQSKSLFNRKYRAYSHGCVRLAKPKELLEKITNGYTSQGYSSVLKKSKSKKTNYVNLTKRIPVRIVYMTAYIDEDGSLYLTDDVYGYDRIQKLKGAI